MRSMSNRIFVDSSVLIEYYKGANTSFLEALFAGTEIRLFINQIVVSEYLYQCIVLDSGGQPAPLTLKRNGRIPEIISGHDHADFLGFFHCLQDDAAIFAVAPALMEQYNLLPNDAIILGLCKLLQIKAVASLDRGDLEVFCQNEGIALLSSVADLEAYQATLR